MVGQMNNAIHFSHLEESRVQFLANILDESDIPLILVSRRLDYLAQVFFPAEIIIESGASRVGWSNFDMVQGLYREPTHVLALTAAAALVALD